MNISDAIHTGNKEVNPRPQSLDVFAEPLDHARLPLRHDSDSPVSLGRDLESTSKQSTQRLLPFSSHTYYSVVRNSKLRNLSRTALAEELLLKLRTKALAAEDSCVIGAAGDLSLLILGTGELLNLRTVVVAGLEAALSPADIRGRAA